MQMVLKMLKTCPPLKWVIFLKVILSRFVRVAVVGGVPVKCFSWQYGEAFIFYGAIRCRHSIQNGFNNLGVV